MMQSLRIAWRSDIAIRIGCHFWFTSGRKVFGNMTATRFIVTASMPTHSFIIPSEGETTLVARITNAAEWKPNSAPAIVFFRRLKKTATSCLPHHRSFYDDVVCFLGPWRMGSLNSYTHSSARLARGYQRYLSSSRCNWCMQSVLY